ncbi:MAG: sulfatase-like hydrolase/transferase [Rhodoglobus sp.]
MGQKPVNVVLIFADDLGAWALGAAGNDEILTPNLDALAANGVRFENFFCTSPVCSPSRASMLTGSIPSQHGVHDWISEGNSGPQAVDFLQGRQTLADVLSGSGYHCGMVGKWHLGASDQPREAYNHWFAHEKGGGPYYGATMFRGKTPETVPGYLTDEIASDSIEFITRASTGSSPFFLNVSFTAPHHPWIDAHPSDLVALYADTDFHSIPSEPPHPWILIQNPETAAAIQDPVGTLVGYFAAVTGLDRAIGRIVAAIGELGIASQTLIAFVGDNGFNAGHHGIWGKGNGTFPQNMYDTSVKVPAIFAQPGRIPAGIVSESLVSGYDLVSTVLDFLDLPWEESEKLPGTSFASILDGSDDPQREHIVVFDEYGPVRMIRTAGWKYVHRIPDGPHELYDLTSDPEERTDLADNPAYAPQSASLREQLFDWFSTYATREADGAYLNVTGLGQRSPIIDGDSVFVPFRDEPRHPTRLHNHPVNEERKYE